LLQVAVAFLQQWCCIWFCLRTFWNYVSVLHEVSYHKAISSVSSVYTT